MNEVKVGGTTFRFPELPDEPGNRGVQLATERREKILAAARKVKTSKCRGPRVGPPRPGDGTFEPAPGDPGSRVTLTDGREVEVWSRAPGRDRWALLDDGTMVRIGDPTGKYAPSATVLTRDEQRAAVVDGVAKMRAPYIASRLVPAERFEWNGSAHHAWNRARRAAETWAVETIRHELYPAVWPTAPAPFVDPRVELTAA